MDGIVIHPPALTLSAYAASAKQSDRFADDPEGLRNVRFGYFGEIGGLLAALKKVKRDQLHETDTKFAAEELGDALWYLVTIADLGGVPPIALGEACALSLRRRFHEVEKTTVEEVTFRSIDAIVAAQGEDEQANRVQLLGELASTAGVMAEDGREQKDFREEPGLADRLGRCLGLLARTTAAFGIRLEDVARSNLSKIKDRWPDPETPYHAFFDSSQTYPPHEQFERTFTVKFEQRKEGDRQLVVQSINGVFVGDRLTDNSAKPDGYRFHDVFHLAYVAHLGWSPVIRGLLKRKRKSKPEIDENQDGARAMIIEEGIATWIFNHAYKRDFYSHVQVGKLEYGLLKQIRSMVDGYEVDRCPLWQWELAILDGFKVFRSLLENNGGLVHVDMNSHSITFEPLEKTTG